MNRKQIANDILKDISTYFSDIDVEIEEFKTRIAVCGESRKIHILSYSVDNENNITLHRIEIREDYRCNRFATFILSIIEYHAYKNGVEFRVKYPENKSFWKHYKEKYNPDVIFVRR